MQPSFEVLATLCRIAATPLYGERIDDASRESFIAAGEYDDAAQAFSPSATTASALLRQAVELVRLALIHADGC